MPRNDPSETGGLFVGRRPGTAPLHYRGAPVRAGATRRRVDGAIAAGLLVIETLILASLWGPQPAAWLWVGSQINYYSDSLMLGITSAFVGMIITTMLTVVLAKRLDHVWSLVRRAAGHPQKEGMLTRIFVIAAAIGVSGFMFWLVFIGGVGSSSMPGAGAG